MPNWLGFNIFIISAYVLSSFFTFGYIKTITKNNYASFLGGIIFGCGSFMIAHLGHTSMIHAAAWMPLLIWSAENLKNNFSKKWSILYVFSILMLVLAGHLQIFIYSITLLLLYIIIIGKTAKMSYKKYLLLNAILFLFAISISIFQLYPTYELTQYTFRKSLSFIEFNQYILSFKLLIFLFFPHLFGNITFYQVPYFGPWNLTEVIVYVGIITLFIVLYILFDNSCRNNIYVRFWLFISIISLFLALGNNIYWLSKLMFTIPIVNKFRCLARHTLEFNFAMSVLASIGIVSLLNSNRRIKVKIYFTILILSGVTLFTILWIYYPDLVEKAHSKNYLLPSFHHNPAIYYSFLFYFLDLLIIWLVIKKTSLISKFLLALFIIINLGYFSYFYEWRTYFLDLKNFLVKKEDLRKIQSKLNSYERILELEGCYNPLITPMLSPLYGMNTIGWYGPLILKDFSQTTGVSQGGWTSPYILFNNNLLSMLNVKYIFAERKSGQKTISFSIGSFCGKKFPDNFYFCLKKPINVTSIEIISNLGCSPHIQQGQVVANVILTDISGKQKIVNLKAGIDSSEWAAECEDVKPIMQHKLAKVYSTWIHRRKNFKNCNAHYYQSLKTINIKNLKQIKFLWNKNIKIGSIGVKAVYLITDEGKIPLTFLDTCSLDILDLNLKNDVIIFLNNKELKKAWLIPNIHYIDKDNMLSIIKSLKDYNYLQEAFIESSNNMSYVFSNFDSNYSIIYDYLKNGRIKMQVNSNSGGFLILSESYYPGWKAYIDGIKTKVYKVNNIIMGIYVPKGGHIVEFLFLPNSFIYSLIFSIFALISFIIIIFLL